MTPLEAVMKIKAMFEAAGAEFAPVVPNPAEAAPAQDAPAAAPVEAAKEYDLKAGGKVMIDKLEIGGKVTITDDAGNQAPAPAGEHELVDGTVVNTDETGTIVEISTAQEETADVVEESPVPGSPAPMDMMIEKVAKCEADIAELKKALDAKNTAMNEQSAKFSQAITDLSDVIVGMINTPSASATESPKDKFNKHVEGKEEKMKRFLELAKNIKK